MVELLILLITLLDKAITVFQTAPDFLYFWRLIMLILQ